MSDREKVLALVENVPDYKLGYLIAYLQGFLDASEDIPNTETITAMQERENGQYTDYPVNMSTANIFESVLKG